MNEDLEYFSVIRSIRVIENADVLSDADATRGIESQDLNIFSLIQRTGLVVFVNKWEPVEGKDNMVIKTLRMPSVSDWPFTDFPIIFGSALTKQRVLKVMDLAKEVYQNKKKVATSKLNEQLLPIIRRTPPLPTRGNISR